MAQNTHETEMDRPQLYLVTPPEIELSRFPTDLARVLDTFDTACLRLSLATTDEDRMMRAADACREVAHARDVPIVISEHALLVTSLMMRDGLGGVPDALAAHAPSDGICGGFDARAYRDVGDLGWQAWDTARRAWTWRGRSDDLLPTTPIEVERYHGPIFLSHGTHDRVWSHKMTERLAERLRLSGNVPEVHLYEGQEHVPNSEGENVFFADLIAFFESHL